MLLAWKFSHIFSVSEFENLTIQFFLVSDLSQNYKQVVPRGVVNIAKLVFDISTVVALTSFSMAMVVMGKSKLHKVSL